MTHSEGGRGSEGSTLRAGAAVRAGGETVPQTVPHRQPRMGDFFGVQRRPCPLLGIRLCTCLISNSLWDVQVGACRSRPIFTLSKCTLKTSTCLSLVMGPNVGSVHHCTATVWVWYTVHLGDGGGTMYIKLFFDKETGPESRLNCANDFTTPFLSWTSTKDFSCILTCSIERFISSLSNPWKQPTR